MEPEVPLPRVFQKQWLAGCAIHTSPSTRAMTTTLRLEGTPMTVLLDSGVPLVTFGVSAIPSDLCAWGNQGGASC